MIKIKDTKRKVKIEIEYSKARDLLGFAMINEDDLKQLVLNIWLKDGERIYHKDIKKITIKKAHTSPQTKEKGLKNGLVFKNSNLNSSPKPKPKKEGEQETNNSPLNNKK
jgi:hypothetical protein